MAITEPAMKAANVTAMRTLPPPTVNSVPEAQPPPSCMPMPNRKAPAITLTPSGASAPLRPRSAASSGANTALAAASMTICARSPAPRPSAMKRRNALVKPNSA